MAPKTRKRILLLKISTALALVAAMGCALGYWFWKKGRLEPWLEKRVTQAYLKDIAPKLPFQVEDFHVDLGFKELVGGRVGDLKLTLRWGAVRWRMEGPIQIRRNGQTGEISAEYDGQATIEPASAPLAEQSPASYQIFAQISGPSEKSGTRDGSELEELRISAHQSRLNWPPLGISGENLEISALWPGNQGAAEVELEAGSLALKPKTTGQGDHVIQLTGLRASISNDLSIQPFRLGESVKFTAALKTAEAIWGDIYLDLPVSKLPVSGELHLKTEKPLRLKRADVELGDGSLNLEALLGENSKQAEVKWQTAALSVKHLLHGWIETASQAQGLSIDPSPLKSVEISEGSLRSRGRAELQLESGKISGIESQTDISGLSFIWPGKSLKVGNLQIRLPYSTRLGMDAVVSAGQIGFKHFRARLGETEVRITPQAGGDFNFLLGKGPALPLAIEGVPLSLSAITGSLHFKGREPLYRLHASLSLPQTPTAPLIQSLCLPAQRFPQATLQLSFPEVEITPGDFDLTGELRLETLGGTVTASGLGFFDLGSEVPESDFDLDIRDIRLDELGDFLGFGEMKGRLEARARDVTFQASLPTHYDFRIEVQPLEKQDPGSWFSRKKVLFSAQAMKNFVKLFAGDGLDSLPGIANWLAFGWPSEVLLGGYSVDYAGISLFSADGGILVETLDSSTASHFEDKDGGEFNLLPDALSGAGKHFILYGPRFKIPLGTKRYPVVLDAAAMGNFVHQVYTQLSAMAESRALEKGKKKNEKTETTQAPDLPTSFAECLPQ